jgi:hypothetical protein
MEPLVRFDWAIKSLLRDKANFDILEGFLSALLKEDIHVLHLHELNLSPEERRAYDSFLQDLSYQASMDRSRWMDGWVAGKSQGAAEGKAEVARNLMAQGVDYAVIMNAIGLSLEQLQQLARE